MIGGDDNPDIEKKHEVEFEHWFRDCICSLRNKENFSNNYAILHAGLIIK